MEYEDILYEVDGHAGIITINREDRLNAFRAKTIEEMIHAFKRAWADSQVRGVLLTGAGQRSFCVGGDVKQRAETGDYGPTDNGLFEAPYLHKLMRDLPKPVIAAVNGMAIGGGHVLHVVCDMSIASESAVFGQAGPRVGSFDAGFGTNFLARVIGEKRAREIWMMLRQYDAHQAKDWGLVNEVVAPDQLMDEAKAWVEHMAGFSPTALRAVKHSFNADTDHQVGMQNIAGAMLDVFSNTPEAKEGVDAFMEKRQPDFSPWA